MKRNSISRYLIYVPLSLIIFLCRVLPVKAVFSLGRFLGKTVYLAAWKRRKIAKSNLKAAFGGSYGDRERERIVFKVFENIGLNLVELLLVPRFNDEYFNNHAEFINTEYVQKALKNGKGVILLTAHYGNWELSSIAFAQRGYPMLVLARQQEPRFLNELLNRYREIKGCRVVRKGIQLRDIISELKQNAIVGMLGDQSGRQGREMDFFGRSVFMAEGAFRISQITGCALIPVFSQRIADKHKIIFETPLICGKKDDQESGLQKAMLEYRDVLQKYIKQAPSQWLWLNKRWKHTKNKSILILTDGKTGHLRQAEAVADIILKSYPESRVRKIIVSYKNKLCAHILSVLTLFFFKIIKNPMSYLKAALRVECYTALEKSFADIVISCGAPARSCALLAAKEDFAKTINIMSNFPFPCGYFNLAIIPAHDRPQRANNVVVTAGALNSMSKEKLSVDAARLQEKILKNNRLKIGLLIGGDSKYYAFNKKIAEKITEELKKFLAKHDAELLLTTSRRTPKEIDDFLHKEFDGDRRCIFRVFPNEKNLDFAVGGILGICQAVIVSGESISMVSEAATSGAYTIVFPLEKKNSCKKTKHELFLKDLSEREFIRLIDVENIGRELMNFKNKTVALRKLDDSIGVEDKLKEKIF